MKMRVVNVLVTISVITLMSGGGGEARRTADPKCLDDCYGRYCSEGSPRLISQCVQLCYRRCFTRHPPHLNNINY